MSAFVIVVVAAVAVGAVVLVGMDQPLCLGALQSFYAAHLVQVAGALGQQAL